MKPMKALWALLTASIFLWSAPVFAEYCTVKPEDNSTSCVFTTKRNPKDAQVIVSYTKQGWSMMIAVFLKEFAMLDGDSKAKTKKGEMHDLKFVTIRRDMTLSRRMMEAPVYIVDEALLHEMANAKGKIRFWLTAEKPKDEVEVEFSAGLFEGLDEYVAETKMVLGDLFENK
jgi:hypothetical protein